MASDFEDHCWKDVVEPKALDIYSHYERKTYVGDKPALLAIDLYKLAYQGGAKPVEELIGRYPSTCGEFAWNAIPATERLFKAARAVDGVPGPRAV